MGIIIGIDYGIKKIGIAQTENSHNIAFGVTTVENKHFFEYFTSFQKRNDVSKIIIGLPKQKDNTPSPIEKEIRNFISVFKRTFPNINVERYDERFTSKIAKNELLNFGAKKQQRRNKKTVDMISATLILQSYLEHQKHLTTKT